MNAEAPNEKIALSLDHNGKVPVTVEGGTLSIDLKGLSEKNLIGPKGHLIKGLKLFVNGARVEAKPVRTDGQITFQLPEGVTPQTLSLTLYEQPILTAQGDGVSGFSIHPDHAHERLTITELRMLGTSEVRLPHIPTPRSKLAGFDRAKHAPITDLHTHSSAQLSADDLMDMAIRNGLNYPVELLEKKLGMQFSDARRARITKGPSYAFHPTQAEGLQCEKKDQQIDVIPLSALTDVQREQLKNKFHVPRDATLTITDMDDEMYRYGNPIVKNPSIAKEMLITIARDCQKKGIQYIELSTASMIDKVEWFGEMIEAVQEAEKMGVTMRFLVGIPRNFAPHQVLGALEKTKYALRHPYVVGVDLLGYEYNSTTSFNWALAHIANWARARDGKSDLKAEHGWDFKRDMVVRIHAGETGKSERNVAGSIAVAKHYDIRMRVAHALNEAEDENLNNTLTKLTDGAGGESKVSFEFCPDSNMGYGNVHDVSGFPFSRWLGSVKSWFLGTDGMGAIQTSPVQLALSAIAGGVTLGQLTQMRATEDHFIAGQKQRDAAKSKAFLSHYGPDVAQANQSFLTGLKEHLGYVNSLGPDPENKKRTILPKSFAGKIPILISGAAGSSWSDIKDPAVRKEIIESMKVLAQTLDPEKVFFVVGRTKGSSRGEVARANDDDINGVTAAIDQAVHDYNEQNPTRSFDMLSLNTEENTDIARSITWLVHQDGTRARVPFNTMNFMRYAEQAGISIFIGGGNFTSAMIEYARKEPRNGQHPTPYLLMSNADGASMDFAKKSELGRTFENHSQLLGRMNKIATDVLGGVSIFRDDAKTKALLSQAERDLPRQRGDG
ncbi:MAG: hypothetical protein J0M34_08500 [Alphaproteobacteria bacterium]|nr:hypothetical protein [Alphaproteobacteria bacterium]